MDKDELLLGLLLAGLSCAMFIALFYAGTWLGWNPYATIITVGSIGILAIFQIGYKIGKKSPPLFELALQWTLSVTMFVITTMAGSEYIPGSFGRVYATVAIAVLLACVGTVFKWRSYRYWWARLMPIDVIAAVWMYQLLPSVGFGAFLIKGTAIWLLAPVASIVACALLVEYCHVRLTRSRGDIEPIH